MRSTSFALVLASLILGACATIDHTSSPQQQLNKSLFAGPGDLVLKIDKERPLENAFGKADIFGRKTKEGFTELRFGGLESNGVVVLFRRDVQIITNETTMSRSPFSSTTGQAKSTMTGTASTFGNTTQYQGTDSTRFSATTISPTQDYHVVVPADTVAVRVQPNERRIPIAGYLIEIISASANSLEYRVIKPE
jgi:hypothetical protein